MPAVNKSAADTTNQEPNLFTRIKYNLLSVGHSVSDKFKDFPKQAEKKLRAAKDSTASILDSVYNYPLHFLLACGFYVKPYWDSSSVFFKNAWSKLKTTMGFEKKAEPTTNTPSGEPPVVIPPCCEKKSPTDDVPSHSHSSPLVVNLHHTPQATLRVESPTSQVGQTPGAPLASCDDSCRLAAR